MGASDSPKLLLDIPSDIPSWPDVLKEGARLLESKALEGKRIIITGGNGGIASGIIDPNDEPTRAALIPLFLKAGAQVTATVRDDAGRAALTKWFGEEVTSGQLIIEDLDLSCKDSIQQFAQRVSQTKRPYDLIVHNAGVFMDVAAHMNVKTPEQIAARYEDDCRVFKTNYQNTKLLADLIGYEGQAVRNTAFITSYAAVGEFDKEYMKIGSLMVNAGYGRSKQFLLRDMLVQAKTGQKQLKHPIMFLDPSGTNFVMTKMSEGAWKNKRNGEIPQRASRIQDVGPGMAAILAYMMVRENFGKLNGQYMNSQAQGLAPEVAQGFYPQGNLGNYAFQPS